MAKPENAFRRAREQHFHGWEATCTEGTALSLLEGSPYTVRFDRPKRPNATPPYESIDAPAIQREMDKLGKQGWECKLILCKANDPVLKRTTNVLTAVVLRHPGTAPTLILDTDGEFIPIGDNGVTADVEVYEGKDKHHVIINGWSSDKPGQGHTTEALATMRQTWPGTIKANGIGQPGSESYAYWTHQLAKGRIDEADDDEGRPVKA